MCSKFKKPEIKGYLEYKGTTGRIIQKLVLEGGKMWTGFIWLRKWKWWGLVNTGKYKKKLAIS
jgi:hypothetical protein